MGPLRTREPKLGLVQGLLRVLLLHDFYNVRQGGRPHEEDILPSFLFSPFPVLTLPFAVEINIVIYQKGLPQASSPSLMFSTVIPTEIWEPSCWAKKIKSFLCFSLRESEGGERRREDPSEHYKHTGRKVQDVAHVLKQLVKWRPNA